MPANTHITSEGHSGGQNPGKQLKNLYLGKSIEDLNGQAKFDASKTLTGLMLSKSGKRVFEAANELYTNAKECDEEKAYVYFMKFIYVFDAIKKTPDYKKDNKYYNSMFLKDVKRALENSEMLSNSLENRYQDRLEDIKMQKQMKEMRLQPKDGCDSNDTKASAEDIFSNGAVNEKKNYVANDDGKDFLIDPKKLYDLMNERCTSFLLIDTRSTQDYKSCRIEHSTSINVPEEILRPGVTCKQIERGLNVEYRSTWIGRYQRDMLILLDWTSSSFDDSAPLTRLKDAIQLWDEPSAKYKCEKKLHLLRGGLENFVLTYPTCVVNPQKARNPPEYAIKKGKGTKRIDELTKAIEYPDLDAAFIASPSPSKEVSLTAGINKLNPTSAIEIKSFPSINSKAVSNYTYGGSDASSAVNVNKQSLYPSTSDLKGIAAFSSGAITISKELSPKRTLGRPTPLIDRSSKPQFPPNSLDVELMNAKNNAFSSVAENGRKDDTPHNLMNETLNSTKLGVDSPTTPNSILDDTIENSTYNNNIIEMSNNEMNENGDATRYNIKTGGPIIPDRSLKAKVILRSLNEYDVSRIPKSEKKFLPEHDIHQILEAEKDLVEDSLELEKKQLDVERQWEILRLKREKEAEEEMKEQIRKKEEALLEELQRLGEEKVNKDTENEDLRKQLQVLKEKLKLESALRQTLESDRQKQDELKRKEVEHQMVRQEVERKREERRQKQREELEERQRRLHEAEEKSQQVKKELEAREMVARNRQKIPLKEDENEKFDSGGLMRRSFSHSSPNIAKMMEDEENAASEMAATIPVPRFNREQKPIGNKEANQTNDRSSPAIHRNMLRGRDVGARNFQGILSASVGKRGLTGLKNLGNTCYMNSVLQCLSNFTIPSQYFMDQTFTRELNRKTSFTKGDVAIEYAELIRALWSGQFRSIAPSDFKRVIGRYNEDFRGYDQQDAHELLSHLIEWLHDDLNEIRGKKEALPEQKNDGVPDLQAAEHAWNMEKLIDKSFIRETFYGQWRSLLSCPSCNWSSIKYEVFFELVLQLPDGNGRCTLDQCIKSFLKPEKVEYKCPRCKVTRSMAKCFEIVRLPLILIIQFKRFMKDGFTQKKQNYVDFELNNLDLGAYANVCDGKLNRYRNYQLYGVCNHFGTMEGGHYIANCYSQVYKKWYKYDDNEVFEIEEPQVKTAAAYILFYSAIN